MRVLALVLCLSLVAPMLMIQLPVQAATDTGGISTYVSDFGFAGKTISILGDSISTFEDYSSGAAADTTNSTIANNAVYYRPSNYSSYGVTVNDTWWKQTADVLGMRVLVNNSWSGSRVLYTDSSAGYLTRCQQLHDNTGSNSGETPDVIVIYLGTNDVKNGGDPGSVSAINYTTLKNASSSYTPSTILEAYALMVYRAMKKYPNAEIYCKTLRSVSYDLNDVFVKQGSVKVAVDGKPLKLPLGTRNGFGMDVQVTMGGVDITEQCYSNGVISIDSVNGDIQVKATRSVDNKAPEIYRWELTSDALLSVNDGGAIYNYATLTAGSCSSNVFTSAQHSLDKPVVLFHNRPWVVEWKSSGDWTGHVLMMAGSAASKTADSTYIYRRPGSDLIALGYCDGSSYHNYGVSLADHGIDGTVKHVYRLVNRVNADGTNMVYLYVDDVELGAMNNYYSGGTAQGTTSDWVSGKDFHSAYIGTTDFPVGNCYLDYIQVNEGTVVRNEFSWEGGDSSLDSITSDNLTQNNVTTLGGSITDGVFNDGCYQLEKTVVLLHSQPWFIEWQSEGSWNSSTGGALLLSSEASSKTNGCSYIFRRKDSSLIALGINNNNKFENYGFKLSDYGIDASADHVYRMVNRLNGDGTNMVYLYVDGVEVGPLNNQYIGATDSYTKSEWLSGKDFTFSYLGNSGFPISNCKLDYLQIWEGGMTGLVQFVNWDGTVLSKQEYYYGDAVLAPEQPARESSETATYTFAGWDKTVDVCKGDTVYTATYTEHLIEYTVVFKNYDGTVLSSEIYHYGDTVKEPAAPKREADETYAYTFAGWDKNVDVCTGDATYTAVYEKTVVAKPQITLSHPTLNFESEIMYNVYYTATDLEDAVEMGLLMFTEPNTDGTAADAVEVVSGYVENGQNYMVHTSGIPAKNLGDTVYFKVYARMADGTYIYSEMAGYNAIAYANSILSNAASTAEMKGLVVAMLNYGAEAQLYFGHNTDKLMNAGLTEAQQAMVRGYDPSMLDDVAPTDSDKHGGFVMNKTAFSAAYPSISFEGALDINYYIVNALPLDGEMTLYYWNRTDYENADRLLVGNATGSMTMTYDGSRYHGIVEGIAAKEMDQTIYATSVYVSGGVTYTTGIIAYSIGTYCEGLAANESAAAQ